MVYTRVYEPPPFDIGEIRRYSGMPKTAENANIDGLIKDCIGEVSDKLIYKVCLREFAISFDGDIIDLGFIKTASRGLKKNLDGCCGIILFAATVGIGIDRLIAKYGVTSPGRAVIFQAIGAERTEALCDAFCDDMAREKARSGLTLRNRFSAGYGDFPISAQREIFAALDCPRKIGLTLNESMLMSPSKSVTAIIGVSPEDSDNDSKMNIKEHKCENCQKTDCAFRQSAAENRGV